MGITGASLDKGTREAIEEEAVLEFILFPLLWCENGAVLAEGPSVDRGLNQ
jgi:hypothetical protein